MQSRLASVGLAQARPNNNAIVTKMLRMCAYRHLSSPRSPACCVSVQAYKGRKSEQSSEIKPFSAIPGPKPLPVIGNLLDIKRNLPSMRLYVERCIKEYGGIFKLKYPGGESNSAPLPHFSRAGQTPSPPPQPE